MGLVSPSLLSSASGFRVERGMTGGRGVVGLFWGGGGFRWGVMGGGCCVVGVIGESYRSNAVSRVLFFSRYCPVFLDSVSGTE